MPLPLFGFTVLAIMIFLILLYFRSTTFRSLSDSIPLKFIALFHSWRIFAGWLFFAYSDRLPETFVTNAAYGDIIAGFLGLSVFIFGHKKWAYLIFHVIGALDFLLAVGTGLTLTILGEGKMSSIAQLPLILIPLFGVPLSGFTHFISLVRISKAKDKRMGDVIR